MVNSGKWDKIEIVVTVTQNIVLQFGYIVPLMFYHAYVLQYCSCKFAALSRVSAPNLKFKSFKVGLHPEKPYISKLLVIGCHKASQELTVVDPPAPWENLECDIKLWV